MNTVLRYAAAVAGLLGAATAAPANPIPVDLANPRDVIRHMPHVAAVVVLAAAGFVLLGLLVARRLRSRH